MLEIEVKLKVSPEEGKKLSDTKMVKQFAVSSREERLVSRYYDTDGLALMQNKYAFRVRETERGFIQSIKTDGSVNSGLHQRNEEEWVIESSQPKLDVLPEALKKVIQKNGGKVEEVFKTDFIRAIWHLELKNGTEIELAFDHGHVCAGNLKKPICEIEMELCEGDKVSLIDAAKSLQREIEATPFDESKAERGYALLKKSKR